VVASLLVLARCAGFVFRAPGFSHPSVPAVVRAAVALLLAAVLAGAGAPHAAEAYDGAAFAIAVAGEFAVGAAFGMAASLLYDAAYAGGRVVDDYVGVKAIAPSLQLVAPSGFGRLWSLAFTGAFFLTGAYRPVLLGFAASFSRLPVGSAPQAAGWATFAGGFASSFFAVALQVAAPSVGLAFVVQIALGALSRAVPRFGSFTLAFPLAFAAALVAAALAVPLYAQSLAGPMLVLPGGP
jgi:flagellar biosynthetic protein FliR